ncbi:hypothetical protein QVD17_00586 [Tagetes erecta]|uniref:Uncharacterized protein n=1 Tax=Tagetes erecta TaxID=13708 RepID=A0AAD8LAH0_TARER|nr:hypothetical protein QVD17_00586 [Tagetes erecta]
MKTIWENGDDDGTFRLPETNLRAGVTKSVMIVQQDEDECNSSSSSSSIGEDSDADGEDEDVDSFDRENGHGFDDAIQALEQALPIRRGISAFYNGKSKSFACLSNVWPVTSSLQDIAKPENAYTRKRRNLGAFKLSDINTRRISKKPKSMKLNFTIGRDDPDITKHATQSQNNRSLAFRSFSMVNLHQPKIRNC